MLAQHSALRVCAPASVPTLVCVCMCACRGVLTSQEPQTEVDHQPTHDPVRLDPLEKDGHKQTDDKALQPRNASNTANTMTWYAIWWYVCSVVGVMCAVSRLKKRGHVTSRS